MKQIPGIDSVSRPARGPKTSSLSSNLASYAASGLLFTAFLTSALAVSALASLARMF